MHLASVPRLAPSDFFFGYIKGKLSDYNCESREDPLNAATEIFAAVDQEVPLSVFASWVNWPKWVIKHEGHYCTKFGKTKDISSRLAEQKGEYELMDRHYLNEKAFV